MGKLVISQQWTGVLAFLYKISWKPLTLDLLRRSFCYLVNRRSLYEVRQYFKYVLQSEGYMLGMRKR